MGEERLHVQEQQQLSKFTSFHLFAFIDPLFVQKPYDIQTCQYYILNIT
jgi:hypothetical protein